MININISDDHKFLILTGLNDFEFKTLKDYFTKEIKNAYIYKIKYPNMPFQVSFFNDFGILLIGLWVELIKVCRKYNFMFYFRPGIESFLYDKDFSEDDFKTYISKLFEDAADHDNKKITLKDYQIKAASMLIKYRHAAVEITTSGGKTLMSYMIFRYILDNKKLKRFLYIVPSKILSTQSSDDFNQYETWIHGKHKWVSSIFTSTSSKSKKALKERKTSTILFSTFQSLVHQPISFFKDFDVIMIDECHHVIAKSVKKVIRKCTSAKYILGMTGTFPKENTCDCFIVESYIGPLVYRLTAFDLINKIKFACPVVIMEIFIDWATVKEKHALYLTRKTKNKDDIESGMRLLKTEQNFVNKNDKRLAFIAEKAIKIKKNTMILFGDVHIGQYGRKIYEYIKENSNKNVYYADGETPEKNRKYFNQKLEEDITGNTIIVASIYTYGEGIDLHNLYSIFLVNTLKSEKQIRQILGRGMRNYTNPVTGEKKENVVLFDFVDDLRYKDTLEEPYWIGENYLWKHFLERNKIYKEQKFPIYRKKIKF